MLFQNYPIFLVTSILSQIYEVSTH